MRALCTHDVVFASQSSEGGDYDYYRTTYSQFKDVMGRAGADLLDMGAKLVKQQSKLQNAKAVPTDVSRSTVIDQYNRVVDVIDGILESAVRRSLFGCLFLNVAK